MPRPINLTTITEHPETDGNPWSDLLFFTDDAPVSTYAAHDALVSLAAAWGTYDPGYDAHNDILSTLQNTIDTLVSFHGALSIAVRYDKLHDANRVLAERLLEGKAHAEDFADLSKRLASIETLRAKHGFTPEQVEAFIQTAFTTKA